MPLPPHFPAICQKIEFLAICPHLCLHMGNPLTPSLLLLTKMLPLGVVAMIYMVKKFVWLEKNWINWM